MSDPITEALIAELRAQDLSVQAALDIGLMYLATSDIPPRTFYALGKAQPTHNLCQLVWNELTAMRERVFAARGIPAPPYDERMMGKEELT